MRRSALRALYLLILPQLILCLVAPFAQSLASSSTESSASTTTWLRPVTERVFSRKKRFLLFTPGTSFKFTGALTKRFLATYPSGFNFNVEAAFYYPVFHNRIDLIPKRLRPKTTAAPKPMGPTTPIIVQIPGSLIRYKARPAKKPAKVQRIDQLPGSAVQWVDSKWPQFEAYNRPGQWAQWDKYGTPNKWTQASTKWQQKLQQQKWTQGTWQKWTTPKPRLWMTNKWQPQSVSEWQPAGGGWRTNGSYGGWTRKSGQRWQRGVALPEDSSAEVGAGVERAVERPTLAQLPTADADTGEATTPEVEADEAAEDEVAEDEEAVGETQFSDTAPDLFDPEPNYIHFPDLEPHTEWRHFHSHRDRRQLYHQFAGLSGILGIDLKSCILRTICDCKRFLMPPGYSLFQDMLRIVFTFPTIDGVNDEYSRIVQADYETCDKELRVACPFNMLNWLMGHQSS